MVEPWRIELQTFALRTSFCEQVFRFFWGFLEAHHTYELGNTLLHWDKSGTGINLALAVFKPLPSVALSS